MSDESGIIVIEQSVSVEFPLPSVRRENAGAGRFEIVRLSQSSAVCDKSLR